MKLGTANIRNFPDMAPSKVAADTETIVANVSLCGLQEIQVGEDTPVVRAALPDHWQLVGGHFTSPIILNTRKWKVLDSSSTHTKRPRLSRVENAFLDITTVVVQSVKRKHLPEFAVANTHLVSGGYNGRHLEDVKAQWDREWRLFGAEVRRLWDRDLTVYVVGDLNHPRPPKLEPHARFTWLSPDGPADHLGELEHPLSVQLVDGVHHTIPLHSDHDLRIVSARLNIL